MTFRVLQSLRMRLAGWRVLLVLLLLVGVIGAVTLAAVVFDAALDLPEPARVSAPWVLALCAVAVLGGGFWGWRRVRESRLARFFERADSSLGNRLINAVQLAAQTTVSPVEECLRREAVELGRRAAVRVAVWPAVRAGLKAAAVLASVACAGWLALGLLGGDVLKAVAPRFLDPHGDHPPYSKLRIEVSPGRAEVLYGGQVEIRARAGSGPLAADKLWVVAKSGTNMTRTLMFLAPDKTFFQTLANLREPAEYFVTDGRARSFRFPIGIRYTPQITLVEVTTVFPQYTGRPAHTARMATEPQALPEDTRISFRVASNRPLKSGRLSLTPVLGGKTSQITLSPAGPNNVVTGAFTLAEPLVFTLSVCDVSQLECAEPRQGRFNILPDERPRLFVIEPGRDAVATPTIRVPVRVQAEDDYGISRVVWLRGHNRSIERPFSMKLALQSGPQSVQAAGSFDFDKLGVRPGDVIEYYFEAADNYPKGPNVTLSRLYKVEIISEEQYKAILRMAAARKALFQPYFQLGAWLRRMAERGRSLEKQAEGGTDAEKQAAFSEAKALAEDLGKYEKELSKLLQEAVMFDVEQSFRNTLVEQHTRVSQARKKLEKALGSGQLDPKAAAEVGAELGELAKKEKEDVNLPADQIAAVARVLAKADTFVKLAHQQATLAQLLRRFADQSGELSRVEQIEMQELAYQQRRIQEQLHAMLGSLPELLAALPEDEQFEPLLKDVNDFIDAVGEAKIEQDLTENASTLANLDGKSGHELALRAAEKMDKLISKCNGLPKEGKMCLRFQPKVQQAMGNTLEQILGAMGASGQGQEGQDGYALFNENAALYGPNSELAGEQAGGRKETSGGGSRRAERLAGNAREPSQKPPAEPGRVRLQPDAKFPLRYRDLVGEYFRVIAESEAQGGEKR